jgi:phosphoglycerate dehydrogenase-like enzyme
VTHEVLLTTPRLFAFEAMIREHLAEHGCEVLEHRAHDMQMKEETLLTLVPEAATGVGYDHIDVEAATARGVTVCTSAGSNHQAVAELTLASG